MYLCKIGERASAEARVRAKALDQEQPDWFWEVSAEDCEDRYGYGRSNTYRVALRIAWAYQIQRRRDLPEKLKKWEGRGFKPA